MSPAVDTGSTSQPVRASEEGTRVRRAAAALVVTALLFYVATLAPGLLWGDSAKFQRMAWQGKLEFDALGHPLWVVLVRPLTLIPGLDPARAANLSSAIFSALALWPAFRITRRLGSSIQTALLACASLAVSHTWWFHAVVAEVYALNSLVSLTVLDALHRLADRRSAPASVRATGACALLGLLYGAACGNHLMLLLWLPGLLLLAPSRISFASASAAGVTPFLLMRLGLEKEESLFDLAARVSSRLLSPSEVARDLVMTAGYLLYQFPSLVLLAAAAAGGALLWRRRRAVATALLALAIPSALFGIAYPVRDRFAFLLPCWILLALPAGCGLDRFFERARSTRARTTALVVATILCVAFPPVFYYAAGRLAGPALSSLGPGAAPRELPWRDAAFHFLYPGRGADDGARRFVEAAFAVLPDRAVLLADYTVAEPLRYARVVEGRRPDVDLLYVAPHLQLSFALERAAEGRPVYIAAADLYHLYYDVGGLSTRFEIKPVGPLRRLVPLHPESEE